MRRWSSALLGLSTTWLGAGASWAAGPTQVLEGVGPERKAPMVRLGVGFDQDYQQSRITRETTLDQGSGPVPTEVQELDHQFVRRRLLVDGRVGLYRRFELRLLAPIVLEQDSQIRFSDGVAGRSTIFGSPNADDPTFSTRFPITTVPQDRSRAGFGDLEVGLAWAPVSNDDRPTWPTVRLAAMVTLPTGEKWDPADIRALPSTDGTGGPGLGLYVFDLSVALSKRAFLGVPTLDPYFEIGTRLPVATGDMADLGLDPAFSGRVRMGTELVFARDRKRDTFYGIDVGISFRYIGSGRTRSQLTDYLPDFDQTQVDADVFEYGDFADPSNYSRSAEGVSCVVDPDTGDPRTPGVPCGEFTRVEDHVRFDGHVGFRIQPQKNFAFTAGVQVGFANDHFITGEAAGTDLDPPDAGTCNGAPCSGRVNRVNSRGVDERSPYFDPRYDAPGGRFRAEDILNVGFFVRAIGRF
ncbi:MAG TPA: hypothetical protein RMG48_19235 [Myxococcales bacterium LLY-WYZ-16_1]|nr:hypothetical protein [Myxococcales bacterium LLY-WYZ-16_1]